MNKFSWIKLVCYGCDMLTAFTSLLREAAVNGSLKASDCEQPRQSRLINGELSHTGMLLTLQTLYPCQFKSVKLSFRV